MTGQPLQRIWLVGLSGSGKSTVARELAGMLGWRVFDSDQEIRRLAGMDIPQIFEECGEGHFRSLERSTAARAADAARVVIATGGGQMANGDLAELMLGSGTVVYLRARPRTCAARLATQLGTEGRPMLDGEGSLTEKIDGLLRRRRPVYESAHHSLDVDDAEPRRLALQIKEFLDADPA